MSLQFINFKRKLARKKYLELDFVLENSDSLVIVDENIKNLDLIKKALSKRLKYDGKIILNEKDIKKDKDYYLFLQDKIGFYNNFTVYQNFKHLLKLFGIKIKKDDLITLIADESVNIYEKYVKLSEVQKEKLHILFSSLVLDDILVIDITSDKFSKEDLLYISSLAQDIINENKTNLILLSNNLNEITNICKKALIISDNKQVYFDDLDKLDIIKDLIIIETESIDEESIYQNLHFDLKVIENKVIIRKSDLEDVLYYFVKANINVLSINDFNENTELYEIER